MDRNLAIQAISDRSTVWDCLVIGGGASGLGTAVEAASRGLRTLLTYRKMGEDCVNRVTQVGGFPSVSSRTAALPLHGSRADAETFSPPAHLAVYGTDRKKIENLAASETGLGDPLSVQLPYLKAEVVWAAREEMARTVEDVLARRTRALLLNSSAAAEAAPGVAEILAEELHRDTGWQTNQVKDFCTLARIYQLRGTN